MIHLSKISVLTAALLVWLGCAVIVHTMVGALSAHHWITAVALLLGVTVSASIGIWLTEHLWAERRWLGGMSTAQRAGCAIAIGLQLSILPL
jgi:hypothetical protein